MAIAALLALEVWLQVFYDDSQEKGRYVKLMDAKRNRGQAPHSVSGKKPYSSPRLVAYGDLKKVTGGGKGGASSDTHSTRHG